MPAAREIGPVMKKLTPAQQAALDIVNTEGVLCMGNGVNKLTIAALEKAGLVTVKWNLYYARRADRPLGKTYPVLDWAAYPVTDDK